MIFVTGKKVPSTTWISCHKHFDFCQFNLDKQNTTRPYTQKLIAILAMKFNLSDNKNKQRMNAAAGIMNRREANKYSRRFPLEWSIDRKIYVRRVSSGAATIRPAHFWPILGDTYVAKTTIKPEIMNCRNIFITTFSIYY